MTSTTARQVDGILWRELQMVKALSGRCLECKAEDPEGLRIPAPCPHSALIEGKMGNLARTGLKSPDFREILGFSAREAEAVQGFSGKRLLYICDEASGIPPQIFEAIEGNRAGGARVVMFGNPTRNEGEFYDAFYSKSRFYHCITVSSEQTPNVIERREVIPGLAGHEWIEEKKEEWGEESALYAVRVKGEFAVNEEGKVFSIHTITTAEQRHAANDGDEESAAGRLFIGLDPAGATGMGDESAFCVRRGFRVLSRFERGRTIFQGLDEHAHLIRLLEVIRAYKLRRETPVVVIDRDGEIGSKLNIELRRYLDENRGEFELVSVRASDRAVRQPHVYDRLRDELAANLGHWFRDGGAIPEDVKLSAELHYWSFSQQVNGKLKIQPKRDARKHLGRSPDRYDALALAVWEPLSLREEAGTDAKNPAAKQPNRNTEVYRPIDPYGGAEWRYDE